MKMTQHQLTPQPSSTCSTRTAQRLPAQPQRHQVCCTRAAVFEHTSMSMLRCGLHRSMQHRTLPHYVCGDYP